MKNLAVGTRKHILMTHYKVLQLVHYHIVYKKCKWDETKTLFIQDEEFNFGTF